MYAYDDPWGEKMEKNAENDFRMTTWIFYPDFYHKLANGYLQGIIGIHVDDSLHAGEIDF